MAARNITIQYALISISAKAEGAIIKRPPMSNLCVGQPDHDAHDPIPLTAPKRCAECGPIVDYDVLKKGVKAGSSFTIIDALEVAEARESYSKEYKGRLTVAPVHAGPFLAKTTAGDTLHYLTPADAANADHYQLLARLVEQHPERAFVGLHTPSSATAMFRLVVREGVLCMEKRVHEDNVRPAPSVGGAVNDAFYAMLDGSLDQFTTDYDPTTYEDAYGKALDAMVEAGETVATPGAEQKPANLSDDDLMAQMQALLEAAK